MSKFTHINEQGNAKMVDVSNKILLNVLLKLILALLLMKQFINKL